MESKKTIRNRPSYKALYLELKREFEEYKREKEEEYRSHYAIDCACPICGSNIDYYAQQGEFVCQNPECKFDKVEIVTYFVDYFSLDEYIPEEEQA